MDALTYNVYWMGINITLAATAVIFGWLAFSTRKKILRILLLVIWLLFIPNTLYIITDLIHLPRQWFEVEGGDKAILIFQYLIFETFGLASFIFSVYPFEKMLRKSKIRRDKLSIALLIILLNFLVGFGIVLGRIEGTNSWDVFVNTERVITDSIHVVFSSSSSLLVLMFGVLGNLIYFAVRGKLNFPQEKLPRRKTKKKRR